MLQLHVAVGSVIGLAFAYALYNTMPSYAAFIDWQFSHPLMSIGLPIGIAIARLTD